MSSEWLALGVLVTLSALAWSCGSVVSYSQAQTEARERQLATLRQNSGGVPLGTESTIDPDERKALPVASDRSGDLIGKTLQRIKPIMSAPETLVIREWASVYILEPISAGVGVQR